MERKKVCSVMDCQKLSREACAHAAQNDRLPVQTVVQVLYYEQERLRDAMNGKENGESSPIQTKNQIHPISNEIVSLRKENEDLKLELAKLKTKLQEIENSTTVKSTVNSPVIATVKSVKSSTVNSPVIATVKSVKSSTVNSPVIASASSPAYSADKPPLPRKSSFMSSVSKKLGKLSPFPRVDGIITPFVKGRTKPNKNRRHSIS